MLRCQDVERKIGSDEILDAGFMERVAVRLHLAMCRNCSNYAKQLRAIRNAVRSACEDFREDPEQLNRLIGRIMGQ